MNVVVRWLQTNRAKLLRLVTALFLVTFFTTAMTSLSDRSPAELVLGDQATAEQIAAFNEKYGYNDPLLVRYWNWLTSALTGDLGNSIVTNQPVVEVIGQRAGVTIELALGVMVLSVIFSLAIALIAVNRPGGLFDRIVNFLSSGLLSLPSFAIGVVLIYLLAVNLGVLPPAGWVGWERNPINHIRSLILPTLTLMLVEIPALTMVLRVDLGRALNEEYILTARSKGLSRPYLLMRHALRPSIAGYLALAGVTLGRLLGGVVIVESLFALPGIGQLTVQSILANDLPVLQGIVVIIALVYVVINAGIDVVQGFVDPRSRVVPA